MGNVPKAVLPEPDMCDQRTFSEGRICMNKVHASVIVFKLRLIYKLNTWLMLSKKQLPVYLKLYPLFSNIHYISGQMHKIR